MTVRRARQISNVGLYLLARMLYTDGKVAILAYTGIYASGVFHWDLATLLLFAILLSPFSIAGGLIGGWLDGMVGSRRAIQIVVCADLYRNDCSCLDHARIRSSSCPTTPLAPRSLWSLPYFQTLPELSYLAITMLLAITITAAFSISRTMMARIAPISMMSQFFGLYALSGTATAFLGHASVTFFTGLFHSQRAGFASTIILLIAGLILMHWVREERAAAIA